MSWHQQPLSYVNPDAVLLEKYLRSPLDHPVVVAMRAEAAASAAHEFRSVSATSSVASSSNSLYTTAPAHIGGGFFQQVNNSTRRAEGTMTAAEQHAAAAGRHGTRPIFDLDSYNRLKDSYVNRRVQAKTMHQQDPSRHDSHLGAFQGDDAAQRHYRHPTGHISDEAARLVKIYSDRREGDMAREELHIKPLMMIPTSSTSPPRRGDDALNTSNTSPDWVRHRMVLQTASHMFGSGGEANEQEQNDRGGGGATSPRSWQDDVIRSITTQFHSSHITAPTPSISPLPSLAVPPPKQPAAPRIAPPASLQQRKTPQDYAATVSKDMAVDVSSLLGGYADDDDGFADALDCTDLSDVVPAPTTNLTEYNHRPVAPHLNQSHLPSRLSSEDAPVHRPTPAFSNAVVPYPTPRELQPAQRGDLTTSTRMSDIIKDREIAEGLDSLHARIDVVRNVMARKAIQSVEESSRDLLQRKASSFFVHLFLFLDEGLSRSSLSDREQLVRTQIVEATRAVSRREVVRTKLFEDWTNTEVVERRRLVHQRDLFMSSLESPWFQLRRIWAPQHNALVDEAAKRREIFRVWALQFLSMAMSCVERSEEFRRRQLLIVRDPMLSLRGVYSAFFNFASGLRPQGVEDDGYFLPTTQHSEMDAAGVSVEEDLQLTTLSPVDLLCLSGASSDDVHHIHAYYAHCPRVIEERMATHPDAPLTRQAAAAAAALPQMPDDSSTPLEWSSFFLQASSNNNATSGRTHTGKPHSSTKRQTPPPVVITKHPSSACAVEITVPTHLWFSWLGDHLLDYFHGQRKEEPQRWSTLKLRRLMQRFAAGRFSAELTLVDYFSLWRPALKLLLREGEERLRIQHEALVPTHLALTHTGRQQLLPNTSIVELLDWHQRAVHQTRVSDAMQDILREYFETAQFECRFESVVRGALYGFFVAWRGRLAFLQSIAEAEDESWETALVVAQRNALNAAVSPVPSSELSSTMAAFTPSVIAAAAPPPLATLAVSPAGSRYIASSDGGDSRSSSTNIQARHQHPLSQHSQHSSFGSLPKRPLEALASMASPFQHNPSSSVPVPQPPYQYVPVEQLPTEPTLPIVTAPSHLLHNIHHQPSDNTNSLTFELYQLADVSTTGWVRLANVAAALRLQKVCFDLPRIARCFQRAARVYEETTGLRNEGSGLVAAPVQYGTASMINREGFDLMIQILFNDLKGSKELPQSILERWQYEQRYHVSPRRN